MPPMKSITSVFQSALYPKGEHMVSSCWCFKGEHGIAITLMFFKPLVTEGEHDAEHSCNVWRPEQEERPLQHVAEPCQGLWKRLP